MFSVKVLERTPIKPRNVSKGVKGVYKVLGRMAKVRAGDIHIYGIPPTSCRPIRMISK